VDQFRTDARFGRFGGVRIHVNQGAQFSEEVSQLETADEVVEREIDIQVAIWGVIVRYDIHLADRTVRAQALFAAAQIRSQQSEALRREFLDFDAIQKHVRPSVLFLIREQSKRDKKKLNAAYAIQSHFMHSKRLAAARATHAK